MKHLEDISIGNRIAITIVIVLAILFALAFIGWISGGWEKADAEEAILDPRAQFEIYQGVPLDRRFLELDRKALDEAYNGHVLLLFSVWLKSGDAEGAKRFANGMRIGREAYATAVREILKREQASEERDRRGR
jgi:hypothetical protein